MHSNILDPCASLIQRTCRATPIFSDLQTSCYALPASSYSMPRCSSGLAMEMKIRTVTWRGLGVLGLSWFWKLYIYMPVCMCMYIGHTRVCIHIPYIIDVSIIKTYTFFERAEYMDKYTKPAVKNRVVDMWKNIPLFLWAYICIRLYSCTLIL